MKRQVFVTFCIIGVLSLFAYLGVRTWNSVSFDRNCSGLLKRAGDANTVEMAKEQLKMAVNYCETHELTSGYTSVMYNTPDEEIGFWYNNLKSSLGELNAVVPNATQMEKSNVLMKLRETLLDTDDKGKTVVTCPKGISRYPYNLLYGIWGIFSLMMIGIPWILIRFTSSRYSASPLGRFRKR
ncbi:MAG: hypothetical protein NT085_02490 [candidate division SR1 bacterium]|nr:hypothetical protein [candidate division SR1 bacterium]